MMNNKISVIIPSLNEEKNIGRAVRAASEARNAEIIVVDGGGVDKTVEIAAAEGARTVQGPLGRALQMNYGAEIADGRILVFLHADTILPKNFDSEVRRLLENEDVAAGAFTLKTDYDSRIMRTLEALVSLRSKWLGMPYGDQAIFMRKDMFDKTGGFPNIPIMEDFVYMRELKKRGAIVISKLTALTSGRRWREVGVIKTTLINQAIIAGYFLGISPSKLNTLRRKLR